MKRTSEQGFTLLELLIVVVVISILALAVLFVLNPAETLRKTRDAQRFADLATMKNALAIFVTTKTTPYLAGVATNDGCKTSATSSWSSGDKIFYSVNDDTITLNDTTLDGGSTSIPAPVQATSSATNALTDGSGWIPVSLASLSGGAPISNLPVDPVNSVSSGSSIGSGDKVYRYACSESDLTFEIDAVLESLAFTSEDNKMTRDGGNNASYYEVGTNLSILGVGTDF
jgi:prepilin-type N-terminal cleavage/methylation domain-containing protein